MILSIARRITFACLFSLLGLGQAMATPLQSLRFEHLSGQPGMPQQGVMAIVQDSHGFMWFGSEGGLSRYDGYRTYMHRHDPNDPRSLANNWVKSVYVDEQGRIWVGSEGGLQLFDPATDSFSSFLPVADDARTSADIDVRKIIGDGRGGLWLATRHGLQHFDPATGEFAFLRHSARDELSLIDDDVSALARDAHGDIWVGTVSGLDRYSVTRKHFEHPGRDLYSNDSSYKGSVTALLAARDHSIWVGGEHGVAHLVWRGTEIERQRYGVAEGLTTEPVSAIAEDRDGRIWVGQPSGLHCLAVNANEFASFIHRAGDAKSLGSDQVLSLFQDRSGTLWLGTKTDGINTADLTASGFHALTASVELAIAGGGLVGVAPDVGAKVWVATRKGEIDLIDGGKGMIQSLHMPLQKHGAESRVPHILQLARSPRGQVWVGTDVGVFKVDPAIQQIVPISNARDTDLSPVEAIHAGRDGDLWYVDRSGLHRVSGTTIHTYARDRADPNGIPDDTIQCLRQDVRGDLWLGTVNGLVRFDRTNGRFERIEHRPNERQTYDGGRVSSVYPDSTGRLWVGNSTGLTLLTRDADGHSEFRHYPMSRVSNILEDDNGRLWLGTDQGIARFDPTTGKSKNFTARDGILDGAVINNAAFVNNEGEFYFTSGAGVTVFRPDSIRDNPSPPPVFVTDLLVFNKSIRGGHLPDGITMDGAIEDAHNVTLSFQHSVFSIEFAALHYADPQRNFYSYRMEGADRDWISADANRRVATYTNLEPGHYVFHVKAANKDGVWNTQGAALAITILPPFWMTWWFRILAVIMTLGVGWAIYRSRIQTLIREQANLEQQVNLRTMEVVRQKELVEQKKAELESSNKALALANKIQEEHRSELTRFLAVASHDLRQPMHALNLYLGAMRNMEMAEGARPLLANARQCAQIMDEMFLALLDLSRLDAQVVEPHVERFKISVVLSRLAVEFTPQAHAKDVEFYIEPCEVYVETDPALVEQILRNLCANAVRYTETGWIAIACSEQGGKLRVAVQDTGIGISPRQQNTVFEEFFQLGNPGRDRNKGLGLGLAIVRRLSRLLATPVTLVSAPNQGSTFAVDLPMSYDQTEHTKAIDVRDLDVGILKGKQVVVVDDEESILDAMRVLLEQWGCEVVVATSGVDAIKQLVNNTAPPDALVCDYRLRLNETGFDVVQELRVEFNHDIPALLITADTAPERIQETLSSGLPVLHKPVQADALRDALVLLLTQAAQTN